MTTNDTSNPANVKVNSNVAPKNPAIPTTARRVKTDNSGNVTGAVVTGAATAVGALAGAFGGGLAANAINNHVDDPDEVEVITHEPAVNPEPAPEPVPVPEPAPAPQPAPAPEPAPQPAPDPDPAPTPDPEVAIVSYDRITNEDGQEMDLLVMQVDGEEIGVLDVNLDGVADVVIADFNHDGELDQTEARVLEDQDVMMNDLLALGSESISTPDNPDVIYAQNDPDYTNNADVNDFFA